MKKALHVFLYAAVCLLVQFCFLAQASARHVRVGFCERYGFSTSPQDGTLSGYGYAYMREISQATGWTIEFQRCEWDNCLRKLESGEIDLFGPLQTTPDRAGRFLFPDQPQGFEYGALYTLPTNNKYFYEDFEAFNGMRVAILPGNYSEQAFIQYCKDNNFQVSFTYAKSVEEMFSLLEAGKVDAIVCGSIIENNTAKVVAKFTVDPYYLVFNKERPELLQEFNAAMRKMRLKNMHFEADIYEQHFKDSTISQPAFTRPEIEYIKTAPVITVGYDPDWEPVEFRDQQTQEYSGIVADLLKAVERNSGLRFSYVHAPTYAAMLNNFVARKLDVATLHSTFPDAKNSNFVRSIPLLNIPVLLVAKAGVTHARNMTIGIFAHAPYEAEARNEYRESRFVVYSSLSEGLQGLLAGDVNTLMISSYAFDEVLSTPHYSDLRPLVSTRFSLPVELGIHDSPGGLLSSVLDKAIERLTQEEVYGSVFANTIRTHNSVSLERVLDEYAYPLVLIIFFVILLSLGAVLTNKQMVEQRLRHVAYTDAKTGIGNWNSMEFNGPKLLTQNCAYVVFDINNFKLLNDYFGFETGDRVLLHIAETLAGFTRRNELAVRCSGDVFALLLQVSDEQALRKRLVQLTEKILSCRPVREMDGFNMSLSYGLCLSNDKLAPLPNLRDRADTARKLFKNNYRTTYAFYDEEIHNHLMLERDIESKMLDALKNGEFHAYYQPKYDLGTDRIVGAEALVRWLSPDQGIIHPCNFIPLFERNGFIVKLDMHILEQVCQKLRQWMDTGHEPVPVSVNFSKLHAMNTNFVQDVLHIVQKYGLSTRLIELELTETAFLENTELLLRIMNEFKQLGFTLSMDDFGTGYSSLNMLRIIPVDVLKLDRAFLDISTDSARGRNIIARVVQMAKDLDMHVVSEGVETAEHVHFLKSVGCDMAQGFFYSPPVSVTVFAQLAFGQQPGRAETSPS